MPRKPLHPCNYPGCPELTAERYCEAHKKLVEQKYEKTRETTTARGYGTRHQKWRVMILNRDPICKECGKRPSTEAHHIDGNVDNVNMENGEGLCKPCHSKKTIRMQGYNKGKK